MTTDLFHYAVTVATAEGDYSVGVTDHPDLVEPLFSLVQLSTMAVVVMPTTASRMLTELAELGEDLLPSQCTPIVAHCLRRIDRMKRGELQTV